MVIYLPRKEIKNSDDFGVHIPDMFLYWYRATNVNIFEDNQIWCVFQ